MCEEVDFYYSFALRIFRPDIVFSNELSTPVDGSFENAVDG